MFDVFLKYVDEKFISFMTFSVVKTFIRFSFSVTFSLIYNVYYNVQKKCLLRINVLHITTEKSYAQTNMPKHRLPQITNRFSTYYYDLVVVDVDVDVRKDYAGHLQTSSSNSKRYKLCFMFIGIQIKAVSSSFLNRWRQYFLNESDDYTIYS